MAFNEPKAARTPACLPRLRGSRVGRSELAKLIYERELAERLTPAETAPSKFEDVCFRKDYWEGLSAFGRWRVFR
jgi:hypothetical protein